MFIFLLWAFPEGRGCSSEPYIEKETVHSASLLFLEMQFEGCFLCSSGVETIGISKLSAERKGSFTFSSESDICFISGNFCLVCLPHSR